KTNIAGHVGGADGYLGIYCGGCVSSRWTFNYNYEQWAASKHFQLGHVLIFNYNPHLHNVRQVDKKNYNDCADHNPLASFNTGSDTLTLETPGLYYSWSLCIGTQISNQN
ncbi:hypothetical protein H5410_001538, partial [Solanum commersonii]